MTPDTPEKRTPIVVIDVLPGGWIARCAGLRLFIDNGLQWTTTGGPKIGDVVGYVDTTGVELDRTVILTEGSQLRLRRGRLADDPTEVFLPRLTEIQAKIPPEKPYLAMNRDPWLKRKKGR